MASIYSCAECGTNLNLNTVHLYPADFYFEAGNKGTLSFSALDSTKFRFEKEDKFRPFFETLDYWGIQRTRTKIKCNGCGRLVGHVYDDGPPLTDSPGQFHFGPSQVIPRASRSPYCNNLILLVYGTTKIAKQESSKEITVKPPMVPDTKSSGAKAKRVGTPPPPPPPPPLPRFWAKKAATESVTNQEIAKFWRQKRIDEEDHLLAAIKAAARIRAKNLSEEDYKYFEELLKDDEGNIGDAANNITKRDGNEVRVGIKDWWTKSKYAYLNQPAINSVDMPKKRTSSYTPNCISCKPISLYPSSLGVF